MPSRIIENPADLADFARFLGFLNLPITVEWVQGRDRSGQQNRLQFQWAREAAEQRGDTTPDEVRCDWKLRHGVPIMRQDSADFRGIYDTLIKPLTYEQKLKAMQLIEVTSLMKVAQMIQYLDTIQRECLEQGLRLTEPDPSLAKHQARYRDAKDQAA